MRIDSHQHFWHYDPIKHEWIDDEMSNIRKDFLPEDLAPILKVNEIDGCVAVQADQTEEETNFLVSLAKENSFIKGIVGWVDLKAENIEDRLAHFKQEPLIKGFRHVLQGEEPSFMLQADFKNGISKLKDFGFTYDLLLFPQHIKAAIELVKENPNQPFVIDHISKPYIKKGIVAGWSEDIKAISEFPNVMIKVSGMVTEADYKNWKKEDFTPYLDIVTEAFGTDRIMFGSDWPVCLVAASYTEMQSIPKEYYATFSNLEQEKILGLNAERFYNL
ncbi:amidohydrolase 2 [Pseudopedobacter saltans DSM 12145]|uniref:Amidohydrolase 2 n=1 Tax=Pseudopedobacter saltans (strain ATCC 51119 / DSM 12145 / JCM 21818 / CCUG 39354 / LMG 10337 / NBRC 100064 / NCIMB 13643) TaxID=762903 RepID=F0S6J0_PSESL|nr:amidohydrolase family protein [Pseudopedobacter saltans]ADY51066.1 amidohydrolase 2 [Pseudopedobacter saltans DSM 12145]